MSKCKEILRNLLCRAAGRMADQEPREWPPECFLFTYQPMRPEVKPEEKTASEK